MDDFSSMPRSEMIQRATWMVLQSVLRGELESGVHQAINFAFNWKHAVDTKEVGHD